MKAQQEEDEQKQKKKQKQADDAADDTETEGKAAIATGRSTSASKSLEPGQQRGSPKDRADWGSRSEISTEDEWERVDETEKDK